MTDEELATEYGVREEALRNAVVEFANAAIARAKGDANLAMRAILSTLVSIEYQLIEIQERRNNEETQGEEAK